MRLLVGLGVLCLTLGCDGGKDVTGDSGGGDDSGEASGEVPEDVQAVFDDHCAPCHVNGGSSGALNLDAGNAYGNLVDEAALVGGTRVVCGDSANSVLFQRMDDGEMPQSGRLDPADPIDAIQAWIDGGC